MSRARPNGLIIQLLCVMKHRRRYGAPGGNTETNVHEEKISKSKQSEHPEAQRTAAAAEDQSDKLSLSLPLTGKHIFFY